MRHTRSELAAAAVFLVSLSLVAGATIWLGFAVHPALGIVSIGLFGGFGALFFIMVHR